MSMVRAAARRAIAALPRAALPGLVVTTAAHCAAARHLLSVSVSTSTTALSIDPGADASDGESLVQEVTSDWQFDAALGDNSRCIAYFKTP